MEKIVLNGILVDKYTSFRKILLDINLSDVEIIKFNNSQFIIPSIQLFFKLNCKKNITQKKVFQAFSMLGLREIKLDDDPLILSDSEKYKLLVAISLINNLTNFIVVYPDLYLDDYNMDIVFKFFKRLSNDYNKNIYIITNDIDLLYRECDSLYIYKKNKIIFSDNRNKLYKNRDIILNNGFALPKILNFISLVEDKKGIILEPTFDIKELMKDVYRNV